MQIAANSVHMVEGGNVIKQGDETPFTFQLQDETSGIVDLTGASVTVRLANKKALLLTKDATINDDNTVTFNITSDDLIGHGDMRVEFLVTHADGKNEIFPAQGYQEVKIVKSLSSLDGGEVPVVTIEEFERRIDEAIQSVDDTVDGIVEAESERVIAETERVTNEQARVDAESVREQQESQRQANTSTAITNAENATNNANTSASNADDKASLAQAKVDELDGLNVEINTAIDNAESATDSANESASNADIATDSANQAAIHAQTQGDYAKAQGDAVQDIFDEGLVASVNGKTGAVVLDSDDVGAISKDEKGVASGVAELNADGKVIDANGNEVEGKVKSVNNVEPDENGNIPITVPSKTSDLENDSSFVSDSDLTSERVNMIDHVDVNVPGDEYPNGITLFNISESGYPHRYGHVKTYRGGAGIAVQYCYGNGLRDTVTSTTTYTRQYHASSGWGRFREVPVLETEPLITGTSPDGAYQRYGGYGIVFKPTSNFILKSVIIDAEGDFSNEIILAEWFEDREREIDVPDAIYLKTVDIKNGQHRYDLNFTIPADGKEYFLYLRYMPPTGNSVRRTSPSGASLEPVAEFITGGRAFPGGGRGSGGDRQTLSNWYWFFDWEVDINSKNIMTNIISEILSGTRVKVSDSQPDTIRPTLWLREDLT